MTRAQEEDNLQMNQKQKSIEQVHEDLHRQQARIRELERQLAELANGKLPEDAHLEPDLIFTGSIVSSTTGEPLVMLRWFTHVTQLSIAQARDLALSLLDAAEAAKSDAFLVSFMGAGDKDPRAGAALVMAFREWREKRNPSEVFFA
jgi:hypothetical protein